MTVTTLRTVFHLLKAQLPVFYLIKSNAVFHLMKTDAMFYPMNAFHSAFYLLNANTVKPDLVGL